MTDRFEEIRSLLRRREAAKIAHPGGTLAAHLERVCERLAELGAREDLQLAGLGHAVYGTDGFAVPLVTTAHREAIRAVLGTEVELIIYRYGATDRKKTWPDLATTGRLWDRFDSSVEALNADDLRDQADLSIVNELDVLEHSEGSPGKQAAYVADLVSRWRSIASPGITQAADAALA